MVVSGLQLPRGDVEAGWWRAVCSRLFLVGHPPSSVFRKPCPANISPLSRSAFSPSWHLSSDNLLIKKHDSTLLEVVVVAGVLGRLGSYLATATSRHLVSHGGRQSLAAWRHCSRDPPHHLLNLPFICRLDPDWLILDIALPLLGYLCSRNYMKLFQIEARTLDMKGHFGEKERCA